MYEGHRTPATSTVLDVKAVDALSRQYSAPERGVRIAGLYVASVAFVAVSLLFGTNSANERGPYATSGTGIRSWNGDPVGAFGGQIADAPSEPALPFCAKVHENVQEQEQIAQLIERQRQRQQAN